MATTKKAVEEAAVEPITELDPWEKVKYKLPRLGTNDMDVYVSVNDYTCIIPRGKTVEIPRCVVAELERSEAAKEAFYKRNLLFQPVEQIFQDNRFT